MNGIIAAAGRCSHSHELWARRNHILPGLAPDLPANRLDHITQAGITETWSLADSDTRRCSVLLHPMHGLPSQFFLQISGTEK